MQLEQTFDVPSSAERVWRWFKDTEAVVTCLPGASLLAPPEDGKLRLAMVVKLGPITANFIGDGEVSFDDAARSGIVVGAAADRKSASRIRGKVRFSVSEQGTSAAPVTTVALAIEQTIAGPLAQFSREGIVRELAQRLTDEFAARLRGKIEVEDAAVPAITTADPMESVESPAIMPALAGEEARPAPPSSQSRPVSAATPPDMPAPATPSPAPAAHSPAPAAHSPAPATPSLAPATPSLAPATPSPGPAAPSPAPAASQASPAATTPPHRASPPTPASLNLGGLLWRMLIERVRKLFGVGRKS